MLMNKYIEMHGQQNIKIHIFCCVQKCISNERSELSEKHAKNCLWFHGYLSSYCSTV